MKFIVIARVAGREYLTNVEAETLLAAEHKVLDEGVCTKFGYGVDSSMAFDRKMMRTDAFVGSALSAEPISFADLVEIIHRHNENLKEKVAASNRIAEIERLMKKLGEELENAKKIIGA